MPIKLKEIANLSGYSISTVSKALNDNHEISEETKDKIRLLAKTHNYVPNQQAVALRVQKCSIVVALIPKHTLSKYAIFLEGLEHKAQDYGYKLLLQQYNNNKLENCNYLNSIGSFSDGLIIFGSKTLKTKLKQQTQFLKTNGIPFITCFDSDSETITEIFSNRKVGESLCQKLIGRINKTA